MRIMNSYRLTIFLDVKTEVAGFETAERREHASGMLKRVVLYLKDV